MRTHRFVRRFAAVSIMVASAALPAGVAHSAANSEAPVVSAGALVDFVDAQGRSAIEDAGLPTKPIAIVRVQVAPVVAPAPADTATPAVPAAADPLAALLADPALMDRLAKALVAHLGDQVLREIAWEVMPELAERMHPKDMP